MTLAKQAFSRLMRAHAKTVTTVHQKSSASSAQMRPTAINALWDTGMSLASAKNVIWVLVLTAMLNQANVRSARKASI